MRTDGRVLRVLVFALITCVVIGMRWILSNVHASSDEYFGVTHDFIWCPEEKIQPSVDAMIEGGVQIVRTPFRWQTIEQVKGEYRWEKIDRCLELLEESDIEVLAILGGTPYWAAKLPEDGKIIGWVEAYPPSDSKYWEDFVREAGEHYKGRITYWQIDNEQNIAEFARPRPDPVGYAERLQIAFKILKSIDPNNVVVMAGMSINGVVENPWSEYTEKDYLQKLYDAGAGPYFDVLALHPYVEADDVQKSISLTKQAREVMVQNGDAKKPIWITEISSTSVKQAQFLKSMFEEFRKLDYVHKVFWFNLLDEPGYEGYGLLTSEMNKKLSFHYYKRATASGSL